MTVLSQTKCIEASVAAGRPAPTRSVFRLLASAAIAASMATGALAQSAYEKLVAASRAEMDAKGGLLKFALDWPESDTKAVIPGFMKEYPFVKKVDYIRENGVGPFGRYLLSIQQGDAVPYDFMHVAEEYEGQYLSTGAFIKPLFDYAELDKSIPADWPHIDEAAKDPRGYYLSISAVVRGIAWNTRMVPPANEPKSWADCLDPKWKGKIVVDSRNKLQAFQFDPVERPRQLAWIKGLIENKVTFIDGQASVLQRVAAGEFPIACAVNFQTTQRMIDEGTKVLKFGLMDPVPLEVGSRVFVGKWSKAPATTQLFTLWVATAGQSLLDKTAYRGFPDEPGNRLYEAAHGKRIISCPPECLARLEEFEKEWSSLIGVSTAK